MAADFLSHTTVRSRATANHEKRHRSIFGIPSDFFDSSQLLPSPYSSVTELPQNSLETLDLKENVDAVSQNAAPALSRWTCNTCKGEFESLQDQRAHFKSDFHRLNVKLSIAGKKIVREEDFDELTSDSLRDYDLSSISGSEDEDDTGDAPQNGVHHKLSESFKLKLLICLPTGERVSVWKGLIMEDSEIVSYGNDKAVNTERNVPCLTEREVIERLKSLIDEPRDKTHLRIVLLATGGHFAGCVFDGDVIVAHKTFHRYVVRAKAGKKQSSKDASGRAAHSAGASLRRHNEFALRKDIQELLSTWRPYFDTSTCIYIHAPSNNRQLLFNGERPYFCKEHCVVRHIPLTVRRPTLKEAKRVYSQLTLVASEADERAIPPSITSTVTEDSPCISKWDIDNLDNDKIEDCSSYKESEELPSSSDSGNEDQHPGLSTALHEAAQSGDASKILELLEQGLDPCIKDERGRTPYMLAKEKEVRNTFRRFMALNLEKWDWHAAKVPSALTKEMEESQAAKQAEKEAKRKARAKELKKLRKAKEKEKKAQAQAAVTQSHGSIIFSDKAQSQPKSDLPIYREEELRRAQATEREKRAAAAERRIAASAAAALNNAQGNSAPTAPSTSLHPVNGLGGELYCSCCNTFLAGKVPFHRYNYKYCSTSCMHVHREILEDS